MCRTEINQEATMTKKVARKKESKQQAINKGSGPKAAKKPAAAANPKKDKAVTQPRADTKAAIVVGLLRREKGATIAEIAKATKWQNHSIRGFISAGVGKKMGLKVESAKNEGGERAYRVVT
jgi:hypothetical protein